MGVIMTIEGAHGVAGDLSLEFTNTTDWNPADPGTGEVLNAYEDLLEWWRIRGIVSADLTKALQERSRRASAGIGALDRAKRLRDDLYAIFAALSREESPPPGSWGRLNNWLEDLPMQLNRDDRHVIGWDWQIGPKDLLSPLRPVIWSAVKLLQSDELRLIRMCDGDRCGWLFVDRSRRGNRRWCAMRDCGNRAKARRHYERHRRGKP